MSLKVLQELVSETNNKLFSYLREYAINNKAKNSATRSEKKAKERLLAELLKANLKSFEDKIQVGEETFVYRAEIADCEETVIDPEKLFEYLNKDINKFMSFVNISKESIKNEFGDTAVIMLSKTNIKKDNFSISQIKY